MNMHYYQFFWVKNTIISICTIIFFGSKNTIIHIHMHADTHYKHAYPLLRLTQTESASGSRQRNEYALMKGIRIIMGF